MNSSSAWLADLLAEETGINPDILGHAHLQSALRARMKESGRSTVESYRQFLQGNLRERAALLSALTVPETWFFREEKAFALLARAANTLHKPVRILCAPCSSGEEAVSAAITLLQTGVSEFCIEGLDLCSTRIEEAERGLYDRHSFRSPTATPDSLPDFFTPVSGAPGCFQITDTVRKHLRYRCANLHHPFAFAHAQEYEVIFCRNLLIYLQEEARVRLLRRLYACLRPGGLLFTGHAETACATLPGLQMLDDRGAFAFRKTAEENAHV